MFYDQLKSLCKAHHTTPTAFVTDILGLSSSKITAWKSGSIPKYGILKDIAAHFNVPISYLFQEDNEHTTQSTLNESEKELITLFKNLSDEDKGRVLGKAETLAEIAAQKAAEEAAKKRDATPKRRTLELFDLPVSAGTGVYLSTNYSAPISVISTPESEQADYAVRISGDSMQPDFCDGDIILVESCESVELGEIGIFILDGESFIKEYGGYRLISRNPQYKDIRLKEYDSISCRGRVIGKAELT